MGNKQKVINRDVNATNRAALAIKLRAQKMTFEEIAAQAGYASPGACRNAIQRELQRVAVKNVEELRAEELAILDTLHQECWKLAMDQKNRGRLFAVDRLLTISEARRKLMGLDIARDTNIAAAQVVIREVPNGYLTQPLPPQEAQS